MTFFEGQSAMPLTLEPTQVLTRAREKCASVPRVLYVRRGVLSSSFGKPSNDFADGMQDRPE